MKKSLKLLRQVNLFTGNPERNRSSKPKKSVVTREKFEKKLQSKKEVRNFFENQLMLPVIGSENVFNHEKILPLLPNEYLKKGFPDLVTRHRSFRVSDSLDTRLTAEQVKRNTYRVVWNDHQIFVSHSELLYGSLEVLTYDGVIEEKVDVLEWVFAPDLVKWHGRKVKVETIPFSFKACCMLCGYDYEIIQQFIYSKLSPAYKQLLEVDFSIAA